MKGYKYKIGDWVKIKQHVEIITYFELHSTKRVDEVKQIYDHRMIGQICGACYKKIGKINYDDEYGSYFTPTKTIFLYQVKRGMLNKPLLVREEDIELINDKGNVLPKLFIYVPDEDRKLLSKWMKNEPRDKKGRWIKNV